jgi:bifunctional DNA-binding transcriptional regulator/antitoxin component of YhaV-PrlF toxin-antitoxin module
MEMATLTVEMAQRGQVTIPKPLREQHRWETGQQFSILDLGGVVVMSPRESKIDALANQLRDDLLMDGATLEDMLVELRRLREAEGQR